MNNSFGYRQFLFPNNQFNDNRTPHRLTGTLSNYNNRPRSHFNNNTRMVRPSTQDGHGRTAGANKPRNSPNRPYMADQGLVINRVAKYMEKLGNRRLDIDQMLTDMQAEYPDYRRRKRSALKYHLRKAVDIIEMEKRINEDSFVDDEDDVIEDDNDGRQSDEPRGRDSPEFAFEGDGDINSTLENSYLQRSAKRSKTSHADGNGVQELINIVSSDEDEDKAEAKVPDAAATEPAPAANKAVISDSPEPQAITAEVNMIREAPKSSRKRRGKAESVMDNKKFKESLEPVKPGVTFKDIGGNEKVLQDVTQLLIHMRHPEVYKTLGVCPPRGFLLHGPPGSGKTLLANAIAGELSIPLLKVAAPELVGGLSGQSEQQIRELFAQAMALSPSVLFIDEIDAITPHRETAHREMERRIVAQILSSMDELSATDEGQRVLVLGATNRPDALDPALRRAGRFDREVCLGIPDRGARLGILRTLSGSLRMDPNLKLEHVAAMTPGFVGADLKSLVTEAAIAAVNRLFNTMHKDVSQQDAPVTTVEVDKENQMEVDATPVQCEDEVKIVESGNASRDHQGKITSNTDKVPVENQDETRSKDADAKKDGKKEDGNDAPEGEVRHVWVADDMAAADDGSQDEIEVLQVKPPSLLHSPPFTPEQLQGVFISVADFEIALKTVQPSAKREGFATVPDVRWEDIGSLQDIRHDLTMAILAPVRHPEQFAAMGLSTPTGVLLCGPPGCGKTLLAKAVANEAGINFISVKGPELLNMYVGESERAVRQCFQRARSSQPCVIFFDEIDALCPKRSGIESGATRVVNQLLTEMDGVESRNGVFLMAATNRPDIVDPAVMRPGRLDKVLYVGLPAAEDRHDILKALTKGGRRPELACDVDLGEVARDHRCEGYTGADLAALVREASLEVLREMVNTSEADEAGAEAGSHRVEPVRLRHFQTALARIRPSVSDKDKKRYEDLRLQYAAVPSSG